jgi:hypothetical protein
MAHLAVWPQITYSGQPSGGPMAKAKTAEDTRTQRQKFIDAAREHGASEDIDVFRRVARTIATAPVTKAKKAARKRKKA